MESEKTLKIIFLDIDGVMNPGFVHDCLDMGPALRPEHVRVLNRIVAQSGARVVVSSAFRIGRSLKFLKKEFADAGFEGEIVGKTPTLHTGRDMEIWTWLEANAADSYVILDDMVSMGTLSRKLVCTYPDGLTEEHIEPILEELRVPASLDFART